MPPKYEPMRFTRVPWGWLEERNDLRRAGGPEAHIFCGRRIEIIGLHVQGQRDMIAIKLCDGLPVSAAHTTAMEANSRWQGDPGDETDRQ